MCNILLPLILLVKSNELIEYEKREKEVLTDNGNGPLFYVGFFGILGSVVLFVSGMLPVGMTAIASNSMSPVFERGSAVLTLKVKEEELKKGDIISFTLGKRVIIHRIDSIVEENGEKRYVTKGDANNVIDDGYVVFDQIKNKVILSIPLVGYPGIFLGELLNN